MKKKDIKILLVDDEPDILEIVGYNLAQAGYQISTATNGKEAVKQAIKIKPHLIIMDVMMPEMNGIDAIKEIRKIEYNVKHVFHMQPCVTEEYSTAVYNAFVDVTQCLNIPQKELLPKFFNESGMHINAFGGGKDAGVGQLTEAAIVPALS